MEVIERHNLNQSETVGYDLYDETNCHYNAEYLKRTKDPNKDPNAQAE